MTTVRWFGLSWGAPVCRPEMRAETPLGELCGWCKEPIELWDSGVLIPSIALQVMAIVPYHVECNTRLVLGSVAHLEGRCACFGGTDGEGDPPYFTRRQSARLVALHVEMVAERERRQMQ